MLNKYDKLKVPQQGLTIWLLTRVLHYLKLLTYVSFFKYILSFSNGPSPENLELRIKIVTEKQSR